MLIDDWLGSEVVVEYVGGRLLEEGVPAGIGAAEARDEAPQKVKTGTFVLHNYDRFGIEVRPREASGPYFLSWGAVLAIAGAEGSQQAASPRERSEADYYGEDAELEEGSPT